MKRFYFILALVCLALSCQKNSDSNSDSKNYLQVVKNELQVRLSDEDFFNLDFSHALLSTGDSGRLFFLNVPFKNKTSTREFVLVKTDRTGRIEVGKIVQLNEVITGNRLSTEIPTSFDGDIIIQSLARNVELVSPVKSGFIESRYKKDSTGRYYVTPDPYIELPEVIIISSYPSSGTRNWSTWYSVNEILGGSGGIGGALYALGGSSSGSNGSGTGGGTGPGTGTGGSSGVNTEQLIYVRPETEVNNPAITLADYLNCFYAIPDAGAVCKITIFTDLPVNGDPTKFFDVSSGSPGHTFIRFEKSNTGQTASQYIGFYPATDWKAAATNAPIPGKWVDNANHEFNASYELTITPDQLRTGLIRIAYLGRFVQYDIDGYNCTDWALDVFNQVVTPAQKLEIPKYDIPGGMAPYGTNTPQGLFIKLRQMMKQGIAGAMVPLVGWAGNSTGPCSTP